ncbi:MAG: hypothetical protein JST08_00975 [Actinobacteria bacterium]|nr:hypothetical protein [Actinomycetota bacterium]
MSRWRFVLLIGGVLVVGGVACAGCGGSGSPEAPPGRTPRAFQGKHLRVEELTVDSRAVGRKLAVSVIVPTRPSATKRRNDVIATVRAHPNAFGDIPVWNDYSKFKAGNAAFVAAVRRGDAKLTAHVWAEEFDSSYPHWPEYLRFYANALAHC